MDEDQKEMMQIAISLGFTIIGEVIQYLRDAGVSEDVIEANWTETKAKHAARPSEKLPIISDAPEVPE